MSFDRSVIGINIRRHRVQLGITQQRLGELANISTSMVSMLERGERIPSMKMLFSVAEHVGATPSALLSSGVL